MNGPYFLGVDGGNTKTVALISDEHGRVIGAARGGCADIYDGAEQALSSLEIAVTGAINNAGVGAPDITSAAFSLAGADWPEDFAFLESAVKKYAPRVTVINDAIGAIIAGAPEGWGASCVCGTGGTSGARSPDGKTWHGGFFHDSSGGGANLGHAALAAVNRAGLGIDPPTLLTDLVLRHYDVSSAAALLHVLTRRENRQARNASKLARLVLDAAQAADPVAQKIVQDQAANAAAYVLVAARKVGIADRPYPLVLAGGVFRHPSNLLANLVVEHVKRAAPGVIPIRIDIEPVAGALLAALQLGGITITAELRRRLHETHPPASLFET